MAGALDARWRQEMEAIVGAVHVLTEADERAPYETDWTGRFRGRTPLVVRPGSVDEVAAVLEVCRREALAVVAQGGNTGLVGGGVPMAGEVVMSLRRLVAVGPVDVVARQVTVSAGATVAAVQAAASQAGLRYAVDFGARDSATVGGSVATNAGGTGVLRHGGTREQVVGLEAVLGTGQTVRRLEGLVKDNAGYHLASLLCGSEGTLGIVTQARLRLVTMPGRWVSALVGFDSVDAAVRAVGEWRATIETLEAAELVVDAGLRLVCEAFGVPAPFRRSWPAYVLVDAASHDDPTAALAAAVAATAGVGDVAVADETARRRALWRYREDHSAAIATIGAPHKLDVTLPMAVLAAFVADSPRRVAELAPGVRTWIFGHVGDGNVHVNLTGLPPDDESIDERVLTWVADLGGSISAEHGIGTAKRRWLHLSRSPDEIAAMRAIKSALDPAGILNPNALFPPP